MTVESARKSSQDPREAGRPVLTFDSIGSELMSYEAGVARSSHDRPASLPLVPLSSSSHRCRLRMPILFKTLSGHAGGRQPTQPASSDLGHPPRLISLHFAVLLETTGGAVPLTCSSSHLSG
jgi:hypothetical protein